MKFKSSWKTKHFKVGKPYNGVEWENLREKYEKIWVKSVSNLPPVEDEMFPHLASAFARD